MDFGGQVAAFAKKAKVGNDRIMRGVTIKLFSATIKSSPVKSGRFRANWQASGKSPASGELNGFADPTATVITTVNGQRVADEFTLSNNLPYAAALEYGGYAGNGPNTVGGFSKQAPQGMVRVNVARFQRLLDEAARENR